MMYDADKNPLDVDGDPIKVGDQILSVDGTGAGFEFVVVRIDDSGVRVSGEYVEKSGYVYKLDCFGKYAEHCKVIGDKDLRMDAGL